MGHQAVTVVVLLVGGVLCGSRLNAQTTDVSRCPATLEPRPVVVASKNGISSTTWTELQNTVTIVIDGLCKWVNDNKADPGDLRLYVAGHLLDKSDKSTPTAVNLAQDYIKFDLRLDPSKNRDEWIKILATVRDTPERRVNIAVGHPGKREVFLSNYFLTFNLYPRYTPFVVAGLVVLLGALVTLAIKSNLLRATAAAAVAVRPPFSLGLVQMAAWFYLIVACYLYIWLLTGEYNTLTEGVLALAGISAATGLGATFVEHQKRQTAAVQRAALTSTQTALQLRIREIAQANPAAGSLLDQELQEKKSQLAKVTADLVTMPASPPPPVSRGFITDILSDADGIRFHRFQVAVWTLVLGIVFIRLVYGEFAMPQFSAMLLGLMGLSSGTYLGFKFPEASK